jgi:hypothetical protein
MTPEERVINITDEFLAMPPVVRRESLARLRQLCLDLGDIVAAVSNVAGEPRQMQRGGAA